MEEQEIGSKDAGINIYDFLIILLKSRRIIIGITCSAAIITAIISFIIPPVYKAETVILPPQSATSATTQIMSQFGAGGNVAASMLLGGGISGMKTPVDYFIAILRSRPVLDRIIDRFNLMGVYGTKSRETAQRNILKIMTAQENRKNGLLYIAIEDKDPNKAANMANAFVEELRNYNKGLALTEAAQRRLFYEEQLKDAKVSLSKTENELKHFMEKSGVLEIKEQSKSALEQMAMLRAQIVAKEVQLKAVRTYATEQNPEFKIVANEIQALKMELGKNESKSGGGYDALMPLAGMPAKGSEYLRRMRDFKFAETLYELLLKQYESAKLDESRDAAVIQVIDKAVPPENKFKPKRAEMVMIAAIAGFVFSVFFVLAREYFNKLSHHPEYQGKVAHIKQLVSLKR